MSVEPYLRPRVARARGEAAAARARAAVPAGAPHSLVDELESIARAAHGSAHPSTARSEVDAVLGAWARAMAQSHGRAPAAGASRAPLPWVLDEGLPGWLDHVPVSAGPVWAVRAHPAIRRALGAARASWVPVCWTHAAAIGDDVVLSRGDDGSWRAALRAPVGLGDPRWDVATVLDWLEVDLASALLPLGRLDLGATFLAAYRDEGGDATPTRPLAVARTLATAVEWTAWLLAQGSDDEDDAWVAGLWRRPLELVGAIGHRDPRRA